MFLSEVLILSPDGTCLLSKNFRRGLSVNSHDAFVARMQEQRLTDSSPHFTVNGLNCFFICRKSLYFCATSTASVPALMVIESLTRFYQILKDCCGTVNEESIRANFILIHELLDEYLNCGYVQLSTTEKLKSYVQSEPAVLRSSENQAAGLFGLEFRIAPSNAADRPVIRPRVDQEQRKNEIFLDIIERLTVVIAANGTMSRGELQGQVNLKCFLDGCPQLKIGLNKDLVIGSKDKSLKSYGNVVYLDKCTFHNSVNLDEFTDKKIISVQPPEGEFSVMTYALEGDFPHGLPFRIYSYIKEDASSRDVELNLKLRCELPGNCQAIDVVAHIPVPSKTTGICQQLSSPNQSAQLMAAEKKIVWRLKKVSNKAEHSASFKLVGAKESKSCLIEIGPIILDFEISGFVCSNLQIQFLRVFDRELSYAPMKWVRYITTSDSYIVKLK